MSTHINPVAKDLAPSNPSLGQVWVDGNLVNWQWSDSAGATGATGPKWNDVGTINTNTLQNNATPVQLPQYPEDGQIWTDSNLVRWRWSSDLDVWVSIGTSTSYPIADVNTTGLMSSQNKRFLDSIPIVAGAFGIVTDQNAIIRSQSNRVGLVSGDIKLHSDSLLIECVDSNGYPYLGQPLPDDPTGVNLAGIKFSLSTNFIDALCLEVVGPTGKKGETGATGPAGVDGFNDGPAGEKGDAGIDATTAYTFSGIKVVDSTDIVDTAVVSLQMNGSAGQMSYTTAKMNVPSNNAPADQIYAQPTQRALTYPTVAENGNDYVTLDDWSLSIPSGDPLSSADTADILLVKMPTDLEVGDVASIELTKLSDFITVVVNAYKAKLVSFQDTWLAQMKSFIETKDAAAREVLSSIAQQVAQCEFKRPIEFCLGIAPSDCSQGVANTLLSADITIADTTIIIDSATNFPTTGPYTIIVGTEHMLVTSGYGTTTWTVTRGVDYTSPTTHTADTAVVLKIEVNIPIVDAGSTPTPAPAGATGVMTTATSTASTDTSSDTTMLSRSKYSSLASFDPTNPAKCLLPYRMMLVIITDEANPVYVTGIPDTNLTIVNYYNNDKAEWEKFIGNLTANQIVALGLLQIPKIGDAYYGDERDMKCADCTLPYDSMRTETFYHLLPEQSPKITSTDIVTFVEKMLSNVTYDDDSNPIRLCGGEFVPNQINILFKSKAMSIDSSDILLEQSALNDAVAELQIAYPDICFVSTISSSSPDHDQDDRWLRDSTAMASRYLCYQCPTTTVPGTDHVVIMCITDEASPIYSYDGYKGPDGISGPVGIPSGMTAWDFDFAKWKDSLAALNGSDNKVRLGILQPQGYAGASPLGGSLKPSTSAWPGDTDRNRITIVQTNTPSFTADDMMTAFKAITNNNDYAATILYVVIDTSGSLGDPDKVDGIVSAGVSLIQKTYPNLIVRTDVVDVGSNKAGELAVPPPISGYITQVASDIYLWGWQYVSPAKQSILFPTLYVRSTIDAAERWLGRAVGVVEQLLYYWMPKPTYIPTAAYQMMILVITDESNCDPSITTNDGYVSYEGSGYNTGYANYTYDKAQWNTWISSLCNSQYVTVGILQLANPGSPSYPEQTDRGPDQYTLADGSKTSGWVIDRTHEFKQDERDILPDMSWGTNINASVEDGSFPKDSRGTITHKVLPWNGFGVKRVTATDIMDFYNEMTNNGALCPDLVVVLLDTTESMKPSLTYWINKAVAEHNNTTHGVEVDQTSSLSYYDTTLGRWIGPRVVDSVDIAETDVGFLMSDEINSAVLALQCIVPPSGFTSYGYKHPLVVEIGYNGRWLQAMNTVTTYFLNKNNDTTFHVGDESWWSSYRSTMCESVANTTIPCSDCGSP